jgi:periplasmic copper chaperone A
VSRGGELAELSIAADREWNSMSQLLAMDWRTRLVQGRHPHVMPNSRQPEKTEALMRRGFQSLRLVIAAMACVVVASTAALAAESGLVVSDPWVRTVIPSRPAAGYFTLSNKTTKPEEMVGASSPACKSVMLHHSVDQNGVERMLMVKSVVVPAGGQIKFAPGGYHLMCMSPSKDVKPGNSMSITLRFKDSSTITASFPIHGAMGTTGTMGEMGTMGK